VGLQFETDAARSEIRTDSYSVSIGEWISQYERRELDIHPEFQRFFRWTREQKSRLIESILLFSMIFWSVVIINLRIN